MATVLYIHGMGGGLDSRIPRLLGSLLPEYRIALREYDFNPLLAREQIAQWVEELKPDLLIGESLGAIHTLSVPGIRKILVSPALNTPAVFCALAPLTKLGWVRRALNRRFKPKEGSRQPLDFSPENMAAWKGFRHEALNCSDSLVAFFGTKDHYRRSGIVSICTYQHRLTGIYTMYKGSHFMPDDAVERLLVRAVRASLDEI